MNKEIKDALDLVETFARRGVYEVSGSEESFNRNSKLLTANLKLIKKELEK